jgi:NAD(P)-dependent dehydrogenase (short-subunit alcohol dehydrogenase family)
MATESLSGKTALVTGGSHGIGRAIAERLGHDGAFVALTYNSDRAAAADVVRSIEASGGRALALQASLEERLAYVELFKRLDAEFTSRFGNTGLDIVVNNAGGAAFAGFQDATPETFDLVFAIYARTPFFIIQAAAERLRDGGRVINISTGLSQRPSPQAPQPVYTMAKAGLNALSHALAAKLGARGITINAVAPGWTDTKSNAPVLENRELVETIEADTALGRFGRPTDIASVVAFLAGPDGAWVTGQYIEASGGYRL